MAIAREWAGNGMTGPGEISVVIPTFQRRASLERALRALRGQDFPAAEYEVVVSIDGSTDGTDRMVARFRADYALRAVSGPNRGRAAACNVGVQAARGRLIVLLDDDMEPIPGFLAAHAAAHRGNPRRGVIGAAPMLVHEGSAPLHRYIADRVNRHMERLGAPGFRVGFRDVYTGNFSIPREAFLEVGRFDEAFRTYGHEDYELALRLLNAGVEISFSPAAVARQHYEKDFAAVAKDNIAKGQNDVRFVAKHPEALGHLRLAGGDGGRWWRLLRAVLLGLGGPLTGTPDRIVRLVGRLEARGARRLDRYYDLAIDYFYWVGVRSGRRERRGRGAAAGQARPREAVQP
jgi:glycosyltransferase involved in cell wall biosynthesis